MIINSLTPIPRFVFAAACIISVHNLTNFHEVRGEMKSHPIKLTDVLILLFIIILTIVGGRGVQ